MIYIYVLVALIGLVIGSFLNVVIYRLPEGKSIIAPPSACKVCGERLKPYDLLPVLSWLFLRGRCRSCKAYFSPRYMLVELLTAAAFLVLLFNYGLSVPFIAYSVFAAILIAVFFIDIDHRIIPDELVLAGLAAGTAVFVYNIFLPGRMPFGDSTWWSPLLGMLLGSGALLLVSLIGSVIYRTDDALGMGDVKLFAPIGLLLGWKLCAAALLFSVFIGGISSLFLMIIGIKGRKDTIPFGPFIVIGTYVAINWGWDIINWYIGRL